MIVIHPPVITEILVYTKIPVTTDGLVRFINTCMAHKNSPGPFIDIEPYQQLLAPWDLYKMPWKNIASVHQQCFGRCCAVDASKMTMSLMANTETQCLILRTPPHKTDHLLWPAD